MKTIFAWSPALRPLLGCAAGFVMAEGTGPPVTWLVFVTGGGCLMLLLYSLLPPRRQFQLVLPLGIVIHLLFITSGGLVAGSMHQVKAVSVNKRTAVLVILEQLERRGYRWRTFAALYHRIGNRLLRAEGRIQLYFPLPDSTLQPRSVIITREDIHPIRNSGNPGAFDYEQYCRIHDINGQVFLSRSDYVTLAQRSPMNLHFAVQKARSWLLKRLTLWMPSGKEKGLAEALLIGYKTDLDAQLVQSYINTGVVHVIAISGLHIGLVYAVLMFLTVPLNRKQTRLVRLVLVLLPLWFFSLMAGGEPSVLRSAVMFTFLALSGLRESRASIYHSLALSAFLLLVINPLWIYDTGFLLSYSAVLSILLFQPMITNLYRPQNSFIVLAWQLIAVTFAAQLLTLPVSIYLFHKIPLLFLFTNLVAVPLSSLILLMLLLITAVSGLPVAASPLADACSFALRNLNLYIERMDGISLTSWDGLLISKPQVYLLYLIIFLIYLGLMQRRKELFIYPATALIPFFILRSWSFILAARQSELIVYNSQKNVVAELVYGRRSTIIAAPEKWEKNLQISNMLNDAAIQYRIRSRKIINKEHLLLFEGHSILLVDSSIINPVADSCIISFAIIGRTEMNPEMILQRFKVRSIILTPALRHSQQLLWEAEALKQRIPVHNISKNGALTVHLHPLPLSPCITQE